MIKRIILLLFFAGAVRATDVDLGSINDITWNLVGNEYVAVFGTPAVDDYSRLWWAFSNTNNPTPDSSFVGTNTGLLVSSPLWVSSSNNISSCYYFDGTADYIWRTNGLGDFTGLTNGTITIWLRPGTTASAIDRFFSISRGDTGAGSGINSAFVINYNYSAPTKFTAACVVDGVSKWNFDAESYQGSGSEGWRMITLVHDGISPKFYRTSIDFTSEGSFTVSTDKTKFFKAVFTDATSKANHISVGITVYSNTVYHGFTGWVDAPVIYNKAFSDAEVATAFWNSCTNYGWTQWDVENKSLFSNASCVVNCTYPSDGTFLPGQSLRYYNAGAWVTRGWGGTLYNGAYWTRKDDNGCYYLDGANDYLNLFSSPFITGVSNFTLFCSFFLWANPTVDNYDALYGKVYDATHRIGAFHCNNARGGIKNHFVVIDNTASLAAYTTNSHLSTGVWHEVAIVFDGAQTNIPSRIKYYHNGVELGLHWENTGDVKTTHSGASSLIFGNDAVANNRYPPLYIRNIRIWGGNGSQFSLTSNEVYNVSHWLE